MPETELNMERLKEQLILHEGYRNKVYRDTVNIPTIGIGFNLQRKDAQYLLTSIGADYQSVFNGSQSLTDDQIDFLFNYTIKDSIQAVAAVISNYHELSDVRKRVLIDMCFNLGLRGFSRFKNTRKAVEEGRFTDAAQLMRQSLWCGQVKSRCKRLSEMMASDVDYIL